MPTDHREELRKIRTFPSLVRYLRDEMDWPISTEDFEELTFDYTPEELGIDSKNAAKIQEIKRLRPLSANQPWGIFFVKFEPKRLPVVTLRRVLSRVVVKKRASANSAERAAWQADDLLFVSNYGEGEERRISFAHFQQNDQKKDLPTLKVLGWDNLDTALHLDHVAEELRTKLAWPADENDAETWRETWRSAFTLVHREVINTSKKLSVELAGLARNIRNRINTVLAIETEDGPISKLMAAFKQALVHDLDEDGFADMYAQTIAYGLLSARVANPSGDTADDFAAAMPVTNPFLKELMETFLDVGGREGKAGQGGGLDFDELGVSEVVELLDAANMEAVVRDFGDKNPQEDPVIHFYELFLKEYDAKKRMQRGVFYTPRPVVSFIVRSVDELLRTEFGLADGLADTTTWGEMAEIFGDIEIPKGAAPNQAFVQILDPATGTGTFLVEVVGLIHKTMTEKWQAEGHGAKKIEQLWNDYVPKHLLPRLHGYELMMAPYAIAHMKIGLKLYETGYHFESDERARVYLTNSLEPAQDFSGRLAFAIPALAHEAEAVNAIKRDQRFTVVIGNPPYSYNSRNVGSYATSLVAAYYSIAGHSLGERNPRGLQDDFVKFIRLAEVTLGQAGTGLCGFIANNSYLDNPTYRGMRYSLLESYDAISILNLHGSSNVSRNNAGLLPDENVFDIQQGVGIMLATKCQSSTNQSRFCYAELLGAREEKFQYLMAHSMKDSVPVVLTPQDSHWLFVPVDLDLWPEYGNYPSVRDVFPVNSVGLYTARDHLCIQWDREQLWHVLLRFTGMKPEEAREFFNLGPDSRDWQVKLARNDLNKSGPSEKHVVPILYRPFDYRWTYYTGNSRGFHCMPREEVMSHMLCEENLALCFMRRSREGSTSNFFVGRRIVDKTILSSADNANVAPLWLHSARENPLLRNRHPNLSPEFLHQLATCLKLPQADEFGFPRGITPEAILHFAYSVFYSPVYRSRYAEFLKIDFPRIPLPGSLDLFRGLAHSGGELVTLHLMDSPKLDGHITTLVGSGDFQVEKVSYSDETVWIDKAKTRGFRGVPEEVWNFHIGGYQVCNKWLKDRQAKGGKNPRPGRVLTDEDIDHYQKIVVALSETIRIMAEIDEVIEAHGGWPDAFALAQDGNTAQ